MTPTRNFLLISLLSLALASGASFAADEKKEEPASTEKADDKTPPPTPRAEVTHHEIKLDGQVIKYTATVGWLIMKDRKTDEPIARFGYTAYTLDGVKDPSRRPVTFAFNGGPGSASLWLHMGVLGPRRVVLSDPVPTPPGPYRTVDNAYGLLDKSDLVMIDPVGTGISWAVCDHKDDEFYAVDPDIDSISRFIAQYLSDNDRWTSPKYLLGESYGTTRGAAIVNYLRTHRSLEFNGLILVSVATDIEAIFAELPGNDRPYSVYLPGYAAVAWYHKALPHQPAALDADYDGPLAGPEFGAALTGHYFNFRKTTIYGGSNEIQKNIVSKMILGF